MDLIQDRSSSCEEQNLNASTIRQYPPYNKQLINQRYLCSVCIEIFNEPYQGSCGCRYCFQCLLDTERNSGKCVLCKEKLNSEDKSPDKAYKKEVLNMTINCITCTWEGKLNDYRDHFGSHKITCQHCGKPFDSIELLNQHIIRDCDLLPISCPYAKAGCKYNGSLNEKNLNQHLKEYLVDHMIYSFEYFNERISNVDAHQSASQSSKIIYLDELSSVKDTQDQQLNSADSLKNVILPYERLVTMVNEVKEREKKMTKEIKQLQKLLTFAQVTIIGLEERLIAREKASFNGTFVWKITGVQQKIQDAKSGKQTSFYSPAFYSHHNGYKMCGRIYLNGDGMGRGTHVSLFLVLMKGEYDALLRWPFRQKVTFILIDQSQNESKENIVDSFKPDPSSASFRRPVSDMNIASGLPLFCSLSKLHSAEHEYINRNVMFIKIIIDIRDFVDI